jgi:SagB-type dehydrogenase family enzyme
MSMMNLRATALLLCWLLPAVRSGLAAEPTIWKLPPPQTSGGKPLMQALRERETVRAFRHDALPLQMLSNLLWAGFGINRPASGRRTAPSAHDAREIDIYVVTRDAVHVYDAAAHALLLVRAADIRALTGRQDFVSEAPVNLVYVADFGKLATDSEADRMFYAASDAGFISENVYLYCASEGLATMVRAYIDREALAKAMLLKPHQHVILAQSVGYPKQAAAPPRQ